MRRPSDRHGAVPQMKPQLGGHRLLSSLAAEGQATGKRKWGRKPKDPEPGVDPDTTANPTDPDSSIMETRRGWVQAIRPSVRTRIVMPQAL